MDVHGVEGKSVASHAFAALASPPGTAQAATSPSAKSGEDVICVSPSTEAITFHKTNQHPVRMFAAIVLVGAVQLIVNLGIRVSQRINEASTTQPSATSFKYVVEDPRRVIQAAFALAMLMAAVSTFIHGLVSRIKSIKTLACIASSLFIYMSAWYALSAADYVVVNGFNYVVRVHGALATVTALLELFSERFVYTWLSIALAIVYYVPIFAACGVFWRADAAVYTQYDFARLLLNSIEPLPLQHFTRFMMAVQRIVLSGLLWYAFESAVKMKLPLLQKLFRRFRAILMVVCVIDIIFVIPMEDSIAMTCIACLIETFMFVVTPLSLIHFMSLTYDSEREVREEALEARRKVESLQHAARARSQFLRYIFHELRNPFGAFDLALDDLRAHPQLKQDAEVSETLSMMQLASDSMAKIMNSVLDLEKIDSGHFTLELAPMNVGELMRTVERTVASRAHAANVALSLTVDPALPSCMLGDQYRIMQCVLNFCTNAIKFVPRDGSGEVNIRVYRKIQQHNRAIRSSTASSKLQKSLQRVPSKIFKHSSLDRGDNRRGSSADIALPNSTILALAHSSEASFSVSQPVSPTQRQRPEADAPITLRGTRSFSALSPMMVEDHADSVSVPMTKLSPGAAQYAARDVYRSLESDSIMMERTNHPRLSPAVAASGHSFIPHLTKTSFPSPIDGMPHGASITVAQSEMPGEGELRHLPFRAVPQTLYSVNLLGCGCTPTEEVIVLRFEVEDNGCGIGQTDMRNLWQPFVQIDAGVHQKGKGTGLGLHITKQIITRHGGKVGANSVEGQGSTFWLEVPLRILRQDVRLDDTKGACDERLPQRHTAWTEGRSDVDVTGTAYHEIDDDELRFAPTLFPTREAAADRGVLPTTVRQQSTEAFAAMLPPVLEGAPLQLPGHAVEAESAGSDGAFAGDRRKSSASSTSSKPSPTAAHLALHGRRLDVATQGYSFMSGTATTMVQETQRTDGSLSMYPISPSSSMHRTATAASLKQQVLEGIRILIVDDVFMNRHFLAKGLQRAIPSAYISHCENGEQALAQVAKSIDANECFHVICMDKEMPVMDGHEASLRLRERNFNGLIVGVTGNALAADQQAFIRHGADLVISKPLKIEQLVNVMVAYFPQGVQTPRTTF